MSPILSQKLSQFFSEYPFSREVLYSVLAVIALFVLRKIINFKISYNKHHKSKKIILIEQNKFKFYLNLLLITIVISIWFSQLHSFFISLFAVAAALVVATKELIMCFTGGLLVSLNHYFNVGDRIEIDDVRGYVVDKTFTATKILEIGPEKNSQQTTGRVITFPNSMFLTKGFKNSSYFQGFSINSFLFKVKSSADIEFLEEKLITKAREISVDYIETAKKYISKFCEKEGFNIPSIEPRIKISLDEKNDIYLLLKMPVQDSEIASIEQQLLRFYIESLAILEKEKK